MDELVRIEAEVTFLSKSKGGRETIPALFGCHYRPHIVIGNPNQRQAVVIGNEIQETYLGVAFLSSSKEVQFNESFLAELILMFYPHPAYESVIPDATFTIREGHIIVGYGKVKRFLSNISPNDIPRNN